MPRSVREIFDSCLEQPASQRLEYLNAVLNPGDQDCKLEVLRLLAAHADMPNGFLTPQSPARQWATGYAVGVYTIVRVLGQGGMGIVYEVRRNDGIFEKRFALKVLSHGQLGTAAAAAFHSERRLLALIDHPFIARIVDGGTAPDGSPYLVMDLVDGVAIDKTTSVDEFGCVTLLAKVCEAVGHLHSKGIVHGDLKPANVLVEPGGTPRLLDFGIARIALSPASGERSAFCTPAYASPEQLSGDPPLFPSDVYSLGILAIVLLTGAHPFAAAINSSKTELFQQAVTTYLGKKSALAADLHSILAKAVAAHPHDRYRSASELKDEFTRYLTGHPVRAHSGGIAYRSAKLIRRQPVATGLIAALMISLGVAGGAAWDNHQLRTLESSLRSQAEAQLLDLPITPDATLTAENLTAIETSLARYRARIANSWFGGPRLTTERSELINVVQKYLTALERSAVNEKNHYLLARLHYEIANLRGYPYEPNLGDLTGASESYRHAVRLSTAGPDDRRMEELNANATSRLAVVTTILEKRANQ